MKPWERFRALAPEERRSFLAASRERFAPPAGSSDAFAEQKWEEAMRDCVCSDSCTSGIQGGPGCTSEPTPHGGYRPPYLAARQPVVGLRPMRLAYAAASALAAILSDDAAPTYSGRPALRVVRAERECCQDSSDCGDPCGGA